MMEVLAQQAAYPYNTQQQQQEQQQQEQHNDNNLKRVSLAPKLRTPLQQRGRVSVYPSVVKKMAV
jgi:hypothetical protein